MFQNNSEFSESEHDLYSSKVVSKVNIILSTPPEGFSGIVYNTGWGTSPDCLRACLYGGGGPQVGEVTRLGGVTRLSI